MYSVIVVLVVAGVNAASCETTAKGKEVAQEEII